MPLLLASVDAAGKLHALQTQFGIEGKYLLIQTVSFAILAFILYRFFFKPVLVTVEERNRKISDGLKHAEEMQVKLTAAQHESAQIVKQAQLESARIVEEARKTAKEYLDRQTQEATAKAGDLFTKAQQTIELEHRKMLAEARSEITRLVVVTAERVLAKQLSDSDRAAYNQAAARELTVI